MLIINLCCNAMEKASGAKQGLKAEGGNLMFKAQSKFFWESVAS